MLLVNHLRFDRSEKVIFEDINITASPGKIIFIKGNNGTGKTTLLKILTGQIKTTNGNADVLGMNIEQRKLARGRKDGKEVPTWV